MDSTEERYLEDYAKTAVNCNSSLEIFEESFSNQPTPSVDKLNDSIRILHECQLKVKLQSVGLEDFQAPSGKI